MFEKLTEINIRPEPFEVYTAAELWTDEHTSQKMLEYHLNEEIDLSSRNKQFIELSAAWIISQFGLGPAASVADFGCGPGLYTTLFAETGADVTGIDFSARSIDHARETAKQQALMIDYIQANYLEFETDKRYDLITMIFCDYCALSPIQRKIMLEKYHDFLKPGGSLMLDVHSLNTFHNREESASYEFNQLDGFWSPGDYYGFLNTFKYPEEKISLDKYTIIEKDRTRVVYNWLQYFNPETLKKEMEESGFVVHEIYSDVAGTPFSSDSADFALAATKATGNSKAS